MLRSLIAMRRWLRLYLRLFRDPRTPRISKLLLGAALVYLVNPFDLTLDAIPLLGQLDDALIVPALVFLALKLTPADIVQDYRRSQP